MSLQAKVLNFFLKKYIKNVQPPVHERSYVEARVMMNQQGYTNQSTPFISKLLQNLVFKNSKSNIQVDEIKLGSIRTLKFSHEKFEENKCILYFHGGGYVAGSPETHQNMLLLLAKLSSKNIYAIDYSLSPEHPFPQAIEDAISSYNALLKLGYESKNIVFGGDSAGGNLALVTTLKLQETKKKLPSKIFLLSPWADLTGEGQSIRDNSISDPYLSYDDWLNTSLSMKKTVEEWYAPNQNYKNPLISPVFANYHNFPETLIQVSDIEILFSDSKEVTSKIKKGDNKVTLSVYRDLPHVWQIFTFLPEAKDALNEISSFISC
jgi:monoterpene epsilon-lactone hydrolase